MFKELIEHVDGMLSFHAINSKNETAAPGVLENYRNGCEQLKIVLAEADIRMQAFDNKVESILHNFEKQSEEVFKPR